MPTNNRPITKIKIKQIDRYKFHMKLYSDSEFINQVFDIEDLSIIVNGIKRFTNLNVNLLLDYLKKIYSSEFIAGFLSHPLKEWQVVKKPPILL